MGIGRRVLQQRHQNSKRSEIDLGGSGNAPKGTGRAIEHPGRNLQPTIRSTARKAAAQRLPASLLDHLVNMNATSTPRMPRIEKFAFLGPVGVLPPCSTTAAARIHRLTGKPRIRPTSTCRQPKRWRHNRGGKPLRKRPQHVQTNRTTSIAGLGNFEKSDETLVAYLVDRF
jgi:hypothetical protein